MRFSVRRLLRLAVAIALALAAFSPFSRLIRRSTGLVLHGSVMAARTAASSRIKPSAKPRGALSRAAVIQAVTPSARRS